MRRPQYLALPYLAGLSMLIALPALGALGISFFEFSGVGPTRFIGVSNYERLVADGAFWRSLGNSFVYVLAAVPTRVVAAVGLALLLFRGGFGVTGARTAVYLPSVVPDVAYALLWLWVLNPFFGPLPAALRVIGVDPPSFLTDPWAARLTIPLMSAFQIGEGFVIALAARRTIPSTLYEAAAVDGASAPFILKGITLPLMAPVIALLAIRDLVLALQVNFVPALILTDGGPRYATTYLPLYAYKQGFSYFRLGYASTISLSMFVVTAIAVLVQYRLARRWKLL